jgi:hypothetical protein
VVSGEREAQAALLDGQQPSKRSAHYSLGLHPGHSRTDSHTGRSETCDLGIDGAAIPWGAAPL